MAQIPAETTGNHRLADIARWRATGGPSMLDELYLNYVPLVPEVRLHLARDAIILWARLEAEAKSAAPAPYWASAWAGGQALARYLLDHPEVVAGKRVLDVGSGSGLAAIAAALAGASAVTANDIDPYAIAAIRANAEVNRVSLSTSPMNLIHGDTYVADFDLITTGDGMYSPALAADMLRFLRRARDGGAEVLLGDPGRGHLPHSDLHMLATYPIAEPTLADAEIRTASVFRLI